ncbi:MAG: glycosyltransferase family 2 protein, partial [Candidatus Poribacteria bacterium]|nr:glycosyltransferase family 2 protein [Candidatus Poribacteria bacterium]
MKTCLLLPAYNVSRTVKRAIREANLFIGDIIVVDDGSRDKTAEIALACGAVVLKHTRNCGKGMALRTGFDYAIRAGYQLIFTMDSDGQHNPSDLPRFLDRFRQTKPDILIGGRFEDRSAMPFHRQLNNRLI